MHKRGLCSIVRCPSVYLSVTLMDCIHMAEDIVKRLVQPACPISLVFWPSATIPNSKGNPFCGGVKYTGVGSDFRLKSPFISETVRDRPIYGCYGTLIGSHRRRIDPCRFRWPWVTPNPCFKDTVYYKST